MALTNVASRTLEILADKTLVVFADPNNLPDDAVVQSRLIRPLEGLWQAAEVHRVLQSNPTATNFCGKVFKNGEPAVFCKDCQTDPTCCLCLSCFENSDHKNHNYRMFASGGGGCCDCGDPEAWTSHVYCSIHEPSRESSGEVNPLENLSPTLIQGTQSFFSAILWYCVDILNWGRVKEVPLDLSCERSRELLATDSFVAMLMNDEVHTYDEVINGLQKHMGLSHPDAVSLATLVDRKGRGFLKRGTEKDCQESATNVNKSLASHPLDIRIFHTAILSHQTCAVHLLHYLKDLAEKSDGFCRLLSIVMSTPNPAVGNQCILDYFFLKDNSLWIEARLGWQRLIMSSIFKDFEYKKQLAICLTNNYFQLSKNFWADTHHHDVCAINLTVQLFTVPSLSRMLVSECNALKIVIDTLREHTLPFRSADTGSLSLHSRNYKHDRIAYLLYDLRYLLRNKPEVWTDEMRERTYEAFESFVKLLSSMNNMDSVKRQQGSHVPIEPPWENSFNFSIVLQMSFTLFQEWCLSDEQVLLKAINIALNEQLNVKLIFKRHIVDRSLMGSGSIDLVLFDILKANVSFHQPLSRFIAGLLCGASLYNLSLAQLLRSPNMDQTLLRLMEPCSQAVVFSSQVLNGMWKRNGYGVLNQAIHYQYQGSSEMMYKKDILMLQSVAAVLDPNVFLYALIYKFRLENWLIKPDSEPYERKERGEDAMRFLITELEEFLHLLIVIFGERYNVGVGEGVTADHALERDLIHMLYFGPQPHSQIMKKFKMSDNESKLTEFIRKVANLRTVSRKSIFELKDEYAQRYDPFYYQYSKAEQSKAEEVWRKKMKASGGLSRIVPAPPCTPPPFSAPYQGILRLLQSPVLIRIFYNIFKAAATDGSKFWSVRLLHQCLHLCAVMLVEEERIGKNDFRRSCLGHDPRNRSILPCLETIKSTSCVEERQYLLNWVIRVLNSAGNINTTAAAAAPVDIELMEQDDIDSPATSRRHMRAEEQRKRVMLQMMEMQKKFYEQHRNELDMIETEPAAKQTNTLTNTGTGPAVGVASLLNRTHSQVAAKCILCQEESHDVAMETDKTFVLSACVQRSSVLRKRFCSPSDDKPPDYMSGLLSAKWGIYTGGCGHVMHSLCWQKYIDNKKQEHSRRYFFPIPGHSILWQVGEYLCPLCQTFGNTVLPLATPLHFTVSSVTPTCPFSLEVCQSLIRAAVIRGADITNTTDTTPVSPVDLPLFNEILRDIFDNQNTYIVPSSHVTCSGNEMQLAMESLFSQFVFMQGYASLPDEKNKDIPLAQWQNCAFTIAGLEHSARGEGKFILDYVSTRQLDTIRSLIQLGWKATNNLETNKLAEYINKLTNILLPAMSAFSEQPSIVEMDIFTLIVNLHFTISALINRLTTEEPHLPHQNQLLAPLVTMIDEYLVTMGTAVQVIQYLLCTSAGMETDPSSATDREGAGVTGSEPEVEEGQALQKLWSLVRSQINSQNSDVPPAPYSLYIGMQEHLYPFLQCTALFFKCLTGINFVHSSASVASNFIDLCTYLSLPVSLSSLFDKPVVQRLCQYLCAHPQLNDIVQCSTGGGGGTAAAVSTPLAVQSTRKLIALPPRYSDLIRIASEFKCPKTAVDSDDSQTVMMCLLCGQLLCTNCYSCQITLPDDETVKIGGLTQHSQICGAGIGVAMWIVESFVVLLDARDTHNVRGCTLTPPYVDKYGEPDPGLRRGNPLDFNEEIYKELQGVWLNHQIPERVRKEMEQNLKLMRIKWSAM